MSDQAATEQIVCALQRFLQRGGVTRVHVAGASATPPALAYLVNFPRLSVVLSGEDEMEIDQQGKIRQMRVSRGDTIFVPPNCWNKPGWSRRVVVLTLLFGKRQTGISLVRQMKTGEPASAIKTHFHRPLEGPVPGILDALMNGPPGDDPANRLLTEALLHCCLKLLKEPLGHTGGKAERSFQNICLYVQEHFQFPLTRDSVADHFRLSPNHVSRLFRSEGLMRFTDYLTFVRLDRAKYMLRNHDRTLGEISLSCGFSEVGYFCRVFKRKAKITPSAYRLLKSTDP